jgi:uncharacterized protein
MSKLLIVLAAALVLYVLWRGLRRDAGPRHGPVAGPDGERMVGCGHCGVHLPLSEAIQSQGRYFCSEEHRRLSSR